MASTQCRIIGTLTASGDRLGAPAAWPTSEASWALWSGKAASSSRRSPAPEPESEPEPAAPSPRPRVMPSPAVATISRWTSLTPPPNVLICAWRPVASTRPRSTAPGEPGTR